MRWTVRTIRKFINNIFLNHLSILRNCSSVQSVFEDAKKISSLQRQIDQIIFQTGLVSNIADDVGSGDLKEKLDLLNFLFFQPTFITFGEYPVNITFVEQMQQSQELLNFLRLLQEKFPDSWQDSIHYSCLSENDRCPKRPAYNCSLGRLFI